MKAWPHSHSASLFPNLHPPACTFIAHFIVWYFQVIKQATCQTPLPHNVGGAAQCLASKSPAYVKAPHGAWTGGPGRKGFTIGRQPHTHNLTQPFLLFFQQTMSYIVEIPCANDITKPMNIVELDQCIDPEYIAVCTRDNKGSFIVAK